MAKSLKDVLNGTRASKMKSGVPGTDPGVDYMPKAGDSAKFAAKHEIEKHESRSGNGDDVFDGSNVKYSLDTPQNSKMGRNKEESKKVYEASETEEAKCNHTPKGKSCPVHGLAECMSAGKINEDSGFKDALPQIVKDIKAKKSAQQLRQTHGTHYKRIANAASNVHGPNYTRAHLLDVAQNAMKEEVELDEVLTKDTPAGKWIKDFVDSDNQKFAGKSKEERTKQALAAYYSKQRNEDLAVPLLGGDDNDDDKSEELEMVKAELKALANKATHLTMNMPHNMHIEPWVQAKIAQAKGMVNDVHDYMIYGDHDKDEEAAPMDTPMTFPGMSVDQGRI